MCVCVCVCVCTQELALPPPEAGFQVLRLPLRDLDDEDIVSDVFTRVYIHSHECTYRYGTVQTMPWSGMFVGVCMRNECVCVCVCV